MRRPIFTLIFVLLLFPIILAAQDVQPPVATEDPSAGLAPTAIVTEEAPAVAVPANAVPIPTVEGGQVAPPAAAVAPPPSAIDPIALPTLITVRSDLELLAGERLGGERPLGWSGSLDTNDPQLPLLTRLDLELLAGRLIAPDQRPVGWFGAIPSSTVAIVRDIRHDLELLADAVGTANVRPSGWTGADPLYRCDRGVQALINVLERGGVFSLNVDANDPNFCALAELQASHFAETSILSSQNTGITTTSNPAAPVAAGQPAPLPGSVLIDTEVAFAFLNRYGTQQVGKIPYGTNVQPVARSFTQFSAMTLVRGPDFEVFIDYRDSTLTDDQFAGLSNVDSSSVSINCNAAWCEPVVYTLGNPASGRTTVPGQPVASGGSGVQAATNTGNKTRVPIENLIINYDGQDANNSAVVRMQLCGGSTAVAGNVCQPVTQVIAPDGSVLQPVGSLNGLSQYRLPYGYSTYSPRSANYFLADVWINTPEAR